MSQFRCYVCDNSNFHVLEKIHPESRIGVCKDCGNVAHMVNVAEEEKLKEYYRYSYRPSPNHMNLLTTAHKRLYIAKFLNEFLSENDGKSLICGDVGCATGYIPAWLRSLGHKATGCELTVNYRRFSEAFYGVPVTEELEPKHKYDLITIYHVLEHLMDPDKKLAKYAELLAPEGRILVSTPEWFDVLEEASGSNIGGFDHLFHKNHINIFSATSLKNIFKKCGLEIVKEDHIVYGQTYLLKKAAGSTGQIIAESWEAQIQKLEKSKEAINLYLAGKHEAACEVWPRFPEPWIALAHGKEAKDPAHQREIFDKALALLPDNMRLLLSYATWLYMRENLQEAVKVYSQINNIKPNETVMIFMGYALGKMGRAAEACRMFHKAAEINPQKWTECMDNICAIAVQQPAWDDRARHAIEKAAAEKAFKENGPVQFSDPYMDGVQKDGK